MVGSLRLVVARYDEDLSWLDGVDKRWHVSVVAKGVDVPNEGREASSYLYAMQKYREDDGWICFVQGRPFDHYPALLTVLNDVVEYHPQFIPLATKFLPATADGSPSHGGLPVKEWFESLIAPWPDTIRFAPGAQFILPGWMLRGKTVEELEALRDLVETVPDGPWVMERLWRHWFVW